MPRPPKEADLTTFAGQIGAAIRARRTRKKLSIEDVAKLAGVPAKSWYNWESGRALPLDRLPVIAAALGCKPKALIPDFTPGELS